MKKLFGISLVFVMFMTMGSAAFADSTADRSGCNNYCGNQWYWQICNSQCGQFNTNDLWQQILKQWGWNCDNSICPDDNNSGSNNGDDTQQPELPDTPTTPSEPTEPTEPNQPSDTTPDNGNSNGSTNTDNDNNSSIENLSYVEQVVALVNEERAKEGLNPVTLDAEISAAAQVRAHEAAQSFSHTRPNGTSCFTALKEAGISYKGAGENIAYGQATPAAVMNDWMNSSGHRANIMNAKYTKIGVGYTVVGGVAYWSQFFTY